jgi:hypothetical protein
MPLVKYSLPSFLEGMLTERAYGLWVSKIAMAALRHDRERKRPFAANTSRSEYGKIVHEAVIAGNGTDPFTGDRLRFDLVDTYDFRKALGDVAYEKQFDDMPTVDHIDPDAKELALEICSWRINFCKSRQTPGEFLDMCETITAYCGQGENAAPCRAKQGTGSELPPLGSPAKYFLPDFLEGICTQDQYRRWLDGRAGKLFSADKRLKRPYAQPGAKWYYKQKINEAALQGRLDPFTGEVLRWELIGTWDPTKKDPDNASVRNFRLLPTVDHVDPESDALEFEICSWRINDCKGDLNPEEFVGVCKKVIEYQKT